MEDEVSMDVLAPVPQTGPFRSSLSFIDLVIGMGKVPRPPPGYSNVLYLKFTVEAANLHQGWDQLLSDANGKHFSALTGVVVWLGIKIYNTERMRVNYVPCGSRILFRGTMEAILQLLALDLWEEICPLRCVRRRLLYYGAPNTLIPPTISPDYNLDLNMI
jgi:hypothetical protein